MAVWDYRDGKLYEAKIWEIKDCPYQNRPYAVVVFDGGIEYNTERNIWLSDLKPSMKINPNRSFGYEGISKLHPFNLHPEEGFEGYPVKSTQIFYFQIHF